MISLCLCLLVNIKINNDARFLFFLFQLLSLTAAPWLFHKLVLKLMVIVPFRKWPNLFGIHFFFPSGGLNRYLNSTQTEDTLVSHCV